MKKIEEEIHFEFNQKYLFKLENNLISEKNNYIEVIINCIQKNKKEEYFEDESLYFLEKYCTEEDFIKIKSKALEYIMNINNGYIYLQKYIDSVLENLDFYLFELNFKVNKLEGFINDLN